MEAAELFDLVDNFYPEHFSTIETLFGDSIRLHLTALPSAQRVSPQPRSLVEERVALAQHYLE